MTEAQQDGHRRRAETMKARTAAGLAWARQWRENYEAASAVTEAAGVAPDVRP